MSLTQITAPNTAPTIAVLNGIQTWILQPGYPGRKLNDEEFEQFCAQNPELRIEMTSEGKMIIMLPVTGKGSNRNFQLTGRFWASAEKDDSGVGFDSSGGFTLPNGAKRSPDVSWIRRERWEAIS